jgi:hypothetical protein
MLDPATIPRIDGDAAAALRAYPQGNPVSKRSPGNHTPITRDLTP